LDCKLSILICTLPEREQLLSELYKNLALQVRDANAFGKVEILRNNEPKGTISTGTKRNILLNESKGEYVIYIDDDDKVAPNYIDLILKAINTGVDCVCVNGYITTNGKDKIHWFMSKDFQNETIQSNGKTVYKRKPNHIAAVKRQIALQIGFPDKSNGEDKYYSDGITPLINTEYIITENIYHYDFKTANKTYE
jgi:glycosyltransferase involved in cell wall biosynthesis